MDISNENYTLISINTVLPIAWETKLIVFLIKVKMVLVSKFLKLIKIN